MKKNKLILIYIAVVAALAIIIYLIPSLVGMLEKTYIAEYGALSVTEETQVLLVRNEEVYVANKSGQINRLMEEGELLKQGTKVIEIEGLGLEEATKQYTQAINRLGDSTISNPMHTNKKAGVVTYHFDGYESTITPETMFKLEKADIVNINLATVFPIKEKVYKKEPVFKIVDNGGWYIVFFTDESRKNLYSEGDTLTVRFQSGNVDCDVYQNDEVNGFRRIILSCNRYYKNAAFERIQEVEILISNEIGVIVDNSSILEIDGQKGVYLKNKLDENVFKPIKIIATDNEQSVLYSKYYNGDDGMLVETIEPYDEVVKSPKI
ncbi:MAG TPA: HlyD family efflux transporter periplasmic adaptor subunit [Anaerovoracaceae bacterium]|nr:HlyD family efflux transporter periplasmic adaptor subunit [Anaerovoracaceae bacterium]